MKKRLPSIIIILFVFFAFNAYSQLIWSTYLGGSSYDNVYGIKVDSIGNSFITGATSSNNFPTSTGSYQQTIHSVQDLYITKLNSNGQNIIFSTFIGGPWSEFGSDITIDKYGNSYITGITGGGGYPTTSGAFKSNTVRGDYSFVTKLNSTGTTLLYSTLIGDGCDYNLKMEITLDAIGNTTIIGSTNSDSFPVTSGAYDIIHDANYDVFITKLNSTGTALIYSTFIGGSDSEWGQSLALDLNGNVFFTGFTYSSDFPSFINLYQNKADAFVSEISSTGSNLMYSNLLGGNSDDLSKSISIDKNGKIYICGWTSSNDFPTTSGAYNTKINGNPDIFLTKINEDFQKLIFSTFIGGTNQNQAWSLALDNNSNAYITGLTFSNDFPITNDAIDTNFNGGYSDCIFTKINTYGNKILYSTYLGGNNSDLGTDIILDNNKEIYLTGITASNNFPITNESFDVSYNGNDDIYILKMKNCDKDSIIQILDTINFPKQSCETDYQDTTITIFNKGNCNLILIGSDFSGTDSSEFSILEAINYPINLSPKNSITMTLRFSSSTKLGMKKAKLNILNNSLNNPYTINLCAHSGFPVIQTDNQIIFPYLICSSFIQNTFIVYNTGTDTLKINYTLFSGKNQYEFVRIEPKYMPVYIKPGDSVPFVIRFIPNDTSGQKTAILSLGTNTCIDSYNINLNASYDYISFKVNKIESDTLIIDLGNYCPGSGSIDTTITIFNKSSIGTTFKIENKDPQLQITPVGKAGKKEGDKPKK
jgi:hypothetical protein